MINFEMLTPEQREVVSSAYGTDRSAERLPNLECAGCVRYLGATTAGAHTYFWHYGVSDGYLTLPIGEQQPELNYNTLTITTFNGGTREWTNDGEETTPPFEFLCHVDTRKLEGYEVNLNSGSYLPEHAATRLGVPPRVPIEWVGHLWMAPWDMTKQISDAMIALTIVHRDGRKVVVL